MSYRTRQFLMLGTVAACAGLAFAVKAADLALAPDEVSETDRVDERCAVARERIAFNQTLESDLVGERVGLWDAAARYLSANADAAGECTVLERYFPGPTLEASAAAHLICRVHGRLRDEPDRRRPMVHRFLAEYRARYGEPDREWLRHLDPDCTAPDCSFSTAPSK